MINEENYYNDNPAKETSTLMQVLQVIFLLCGGVLVIFLVMVFKLIGGGSTGSNGMKTGR